MMNDAPLSRALIICAAVFIIVAGLKIAQPVVVPIFVAFFLTILTSPAVTFLVKMHFPKGLAITIVVFLLFGFTYALGSIVISSTDQFIERLPDYERQLAALLQRVEDRIPWLVNDGREMFQQWQPTENAISYIGTVFSGLGSVLTAFILVLFTLVFSLLEAQSASDKVRLILGDDNHSMDYVRRFSKLVQRYLLVKSLISLVTGILVGLFLWLLGIDYPILWGTLAFLMNFIPNVGSLLAAVPPILLALIQQGWTGFFMVGTGFFAINMIIGNLIEPRLMGKALDISALIVFLSLVFWGWVLGPIGMLLAIPLTVVVKIGLEVYPRSRWLAELISQ